MRRSQRTFVPKNIYELMDPQDQQLFQAGFTTSQDREKWHKGKEKELHDQFAGWLDRNGFLGHYIHPRMDKKTGIGKGVFDFTIWKAGRIAFVEFKTSAGRLSMEQRYFFDAQINDGTPALVARSYEEATAFVTNVFA
jgi:hypothetical protein